MELKSDPNTARQAEQAHHDKPRVGFVHNCYTTALGKLFQESVKGVIERVIGKCHPLLIRYRVNGDKERYREGLKNPDSVFVYDDPMLDLLNRTLKETAREYLTDSDARRKQEIVCQSIDMLLMLAFEDVYYRPLLKKEMQNVILAFAKHPEYLELTQDEAYVDTIFNGFVHETNDRKARHAEFVRLVREGR